MKNLVFLFFSFLPIVSLAQPIGFRSASLAELSGDRMKAYVLYKAMISDDALVLSKRGHLALSLGFVNDAWYCSEVLLDKEDAESYCEGVLLRMRFLRLQRQGFLAQKLFNQFSLQEKCSSLFFSLYYEAAKLYHQIGQVNEENKIKSLVPFDTPEGYILSGLWEPLIDPIELFPLKVILDFQPKEHHRIQIGAFQSWKNLKAQANRLRLFNWEPFVKKKKRLDKEIYVLFLWSEHVIEDVKKLKEQGFSELLVL